ncbi:MAG: hypothetical protein ACO3SX_07735, partial [Vulcanococcus sp.]
IISRESELTKEPAVISFGTGREVSSKDIGELALQHLAGMSDVAYIRFASVYRQFQSVADFVATLDGLNRKPKGKSLAAVG